MPVSSKDFHVVAYFKPSEKGEDRRVLSHGEVRDNDSITVEQQDDDHYLDGYVENSDGRLSISVNSTHYDITTGKKSIPLDGGTLVVEARRLVDGKGKVLEPRKLNAIGVRMLDAQLNKEQQLGALKDEVKGELTALGELRSQHTDGVRIERISAELKRLLPKTASAFGAAIERWQAKVEGPLAAREAEAQALLSAAKVTPSQVARLADKRERLEGALTDHGELLGLLNEALARIQSELPQGRLNTEGRRGRMLRDVDTALAQALNGLSLDNGIDDAFEAQFTRMEALNSPGFDITGKVSITPTLGKGGAVLDWKVRFENNGKQAFNGTVVFSDGEKNGGIGLESMAVPHKGCAAEQALIIGADYGGVQALPGERVRLGVRSFGWVEIPLPKSGTVSVDIADFTVENDGQNRAEDWNSRHLEDKRQEKFDTGKVRFFVNDKPWWPR